MNRKQQPSDAFVAPDAVEYGNCFSAGRRGILNGWAQRHPSTVLPAACRAQRLNCPSKIMRPQAGGSSLGRAAACEAQLDHEVAPERGEMARAALWPATTRLLNARVDVTVQVTNNFLVSNEDPKAVAFNYQAVAENHSLRAALGLMTQDRV